MVVSREGGPPEQRGEEGEVPEGVSHLGEVASKSGLWTRASVGVEVNEVDVDGGSATDGEDGLGGGVSDSFGPWPLGGY